MIWIIATVPLMLVAVLMATLPLVVTMAREHRAEQRRLLADVSPLPATGSSLEDVAA